MLNDMVALATQQAELFVRSNYRRIPATDLSLDARCGDIWVNPELGVAVPLSSAREYPAGGSRNLEYYGGFEYVNDRHRHVVGGWVFYSVEDEGVREDLETLEEETA